ncbi:MAG: hypothetical protein QXH32_06100 [Candidatus Caldarchaeum sp.]
MGRCSRRPRWGRARIDVSAAARTLNALNEGDGKKLRKLVVMKLDFFENHVLKWFLTFCSDIKSLNSPRC